MRAKISDKAHHSIRIKIVDETGRDVIFTLKHSGLHVRYPKDMALEIRGLILNVDAFFKSGKGGGNFGAVFKSLQSMAQDSISFADLSTKLSQSSAPV
jgi:hypothetical protein